MTRRKLAADFRMDRREVLKRGSALGLGVASMAALGGGHVAAARGQEEEGVRGGVLNVAVIGEPPTLDIHQTTATIVATITWSMYESLFTFDQDFNVIPMLAESHEVSEDGLLHTVTLRQGVPFHNGEEMKAADVIASFERWSGISGTGASLMEAVDEYVAVDDYTVEFRMVHPFGAFLPTVSQMNQGMAIYPKSVIDAAGTEPLTDYVGTGPYKFVEHQADRFIRLERFDDYAALDGEPQGYGGHKYQYVDEMMFIPVPDEAARIAGLRAGDYHYLESISADQSEGLQDDPNVVIDVLAPSTWRTFVLNWRSPLMGDVKIRQAFQAALDHEQILQASEGEGFYRLDAGIMLKETAWNSQAGAELYNQNDTEKAKQLLEEAGYDGTPLRFMTTQEYLYYYNASVVAKQQLEAAGFVVDLQVYDWATLIDRRGDEEAWDIVPTGISFKPDPTMLSIMQLCSWPGWWCSDTSRDLLDQLQAESDDAVRHEVFDKLQQAFYDEVPMIKVGDAASLSSRSALLQGFSPQTQHGEIFWNAWISE